MLDDVQLARQQPLLTRDALQSWLDARRAGFEAIVVEDSCRGIDTNGSMARAWADMAAAGAAAADETGESEDEEESDCR